MSNSTKLTSVIVIEDIYNDFKVKTISDDINLQKLVNRSISLYNSDEGFRKIINDYDKLTEKNNKF